MTACVDCRFWRRLADAAPDTPIEDDDFHLWGVCNQQNDPDSPLVIFSMDSSHYSSWITTRDTFSCSAWAERAPVPKMQCPDGGTCHHQCGIPAFHGRCFRVESCGPLSGVYPNDDWPVPAPNPKEIT